MGRTTGGFLARLRRWLNTFEDGSEDLERWDRLFEELRDDVLAGYDNDEALGDDCLNIALDVRALAAVLASNKVAPPLLVGLFGDWGSGKSFFMTKLRERVDQLAAAARAKPSAESWFCGQRGEVIQIEFNAWHYMDADLWSSLAVRVFDELSDRLKAEFARACVDKLASLHDRAVELEAQKTSLDATRKLLDGEIETQKQLREQRVVEAREYAETAERQIARDIAADPEVQAASRQLRVHGEAIRSELVLAAVDLQTIFGAAHRLWRTRRAPQQVAVALLYGAPVLVGALTWAYANAAGSLVPLLATVVAGIAAVRRAAAPVKQLLERATARVDQLEAEARAKQTVKETELEAERAQISTRIAELEKQQAAIDQQERELAAQLAELHKTDKRSLQDFILKRASANDYRKNLGVVSAVHKDFKELAEFLKPGGSPPHVERIILYIDDLDRCTPSRVVEVLQAIHVILSLPLFVVVVGVDSQWLLDSLTTYYRRQFHANAEVMDAARPQQYLEKIFQIPFTLLPMSPTGYERLVGSLLQRQTTTASGTQPPTRTRDAAGEHPVAGPRAAAPPDAAQRASAQSGGNMRIDLQPRGLELEPCEFQHIATLSALVGSPRSAKRLVNLYRIVRSTLDDDSLDQFVDGGGHEIALICLAIAIGNPALGADLFRDILTGALQTPAALSAWCTERATGASGRERVTLTEIERRIAAFTDWPAVLAAVRRVARFSFETGRVLRAYLVDKPVNDAVTP